MAKKKSKIGKQKQNKAKSVNKKRKQIASKFNVPFSKNGDFMKPNNSTGIAAAAATTKTPANSPKDAIKGKYIVGKKKLFKKLFQSSTAGSTSRLPKRNDEQATFEHEYKSLQERQYHLKFQQSASKHNTNQIVMTPATLQINQTPTAEELVADAANQISKFDEFGKPLFSSSGNYSSDISNNALTGTSNILQVMAAQKRQEMAVASSYMNQKEDKMKDNSYWALHDTDSDEEQDKQESQPSFNFAAPSFSLPPSSFHNRQVDDDPDL
mmetsp:Transcript_8542/g.10796  ORF Transcript_8542/g.10796 Transcript_8542/m.10796 type:complete len:268 (+) Transcript_8542:97-900(+)